MTGRSVTTDRFQARFGISPLSILLLKNLLTGQAVARKAAQSFVVRTPLRLSDPAFLTEVESVSNEGTDLVFVVTDVSRRCRAAVRVSPHGEGLQWSVRVSGPEPIWLVEWRLTGLDLEEVILPALGGQALKKQMPDGTVLSYKYPFWWNAQFVIGAMRRGGVWLHTMEIEPKFKLIRVRKSGERFDLTYGFEAEGPLTSTTLEGTWYLDAYKGGWNVPVGHHRGWMEEAFGAVELSRNPFSPPWATDINFVLEIWGIGKEFPGPLHTFDESIRRLKAWSRLHDPAKTLVYLPGFAEHGIDSRAPFYRPSPELGGEDGFRRMVDVAHGMGYRIMAHTNVLAMTFDHPLFERLKQHQIVDVFARPQGWSMDIDGDWLGEPYFAYINPGAREWGDLMQEIIGELISKFALDAIFLDQTLLAFNTCQGPNVQKGMREHIQRLQRAFPATLFAGEGLHEQVLAALPMAQIHGIDSISEIHGMEGKVRWRTAHPVSTELFRPYTTFTAHLLTKHPTHPMFALQEEAYARLGVLPALCLYNKDQAMDLPATRAMIRRANRLSGNRS
jgi:hypothetical protein